MNEESILVKIKILYQSILKEIVTDENHKKVNPTPTQMRIIDYMVKHKEEDIYQKDLESVLGITRATVSDVLGTMEKYGLIKRVVSETDSRTRKIIIQDVAIKNMAEGEKKIKELERKINSNIPKEKLEIFNEVISQMIKNIEENALQK